MPRVVNLGTFRDGRTAQAQQFAAQLAEQRKQKQQAALQEQQTANEASKLKLRLAELQLEEDAKNKQNAIETWKRVSMRASNLDKTNLAMFEDSKQYKTIIKDIIKPYAPELLDDNGKIMYNRDAKYVPKTQQEAIDLKVKTEEALQNVKNKNYRAEDLNAVVQMASTARLLGKKDEANELFKIAQVIAEKFKEQKTINTPNKYNEAIGESGNVKQVDNSQWWNALK